MHGVFAVSAGLEYMEGTRGEGIVPCAADVLCMSAVGGIKGVGGVCGMCMCLARGGEWIRGLGLWFTTTVGTGECWTCVCVWIAVVWVEYLGSVWDIGTGCERVGWYYVCVSYKSRLLYRWKVHVFVYCVMQIPAHLICTQCSILLYFINICFPQCISQIQTCFRVVIGPGIG